MKRAVPTLGMHPSTNTTAADSRPSATLDANHPKTVRFAASAMTRLHSATARCGRRITFRPVRRARSATTTAGNYKAYSVTGTHQGVSGCLSCHGPTVAATF